MTDLFNLIHRLDSLAEEGIEVRLASSARGVEIQGRKGVWRCARCVPWSRLRISTLVSREVGKAIDRVLAELK